MREFVSLMKALSDESRLRILVALDGRELCLCQIVELLGLATSTVSRHTAILQQARVVDSRKSGRWTYFRRASHEKSDIAAQVCDLAICVLAKEPLIRDDAKRLKQLLKLDPEQLCRRQDACR